MNSETFLGFHYRTPDEEFWDMGTQSFCKLTDDQPHDGNPAREPAVPALRSRKVGTGLPHGLADTSEARRRQEGRLVEGVERMMEGEPVRTPYVVLPQSYTLSSIRKIVHKDMQQPSFREFRPKCPVALWSCSTRCL